MLYTQESLYLLKPKEFEELCSRVIKDILDIKDIELTDVYSDNGVDIIGKLNNEVIAIEVKHKLRLNRKEVQNIFDKLVHSSLHPKHVVLMTSASIRDIDTRPIENAQTGITYHYVWANDILAVLNKDEINKPELKVAVNRSKKQMIELTFSLVTIIASSIALGVTSIDLINKNEKPPLEKRIETVEVVIGNLKDLEGQLTDIKEEMIETQRAKILIEKEYAEAQELEKLTDKQLESLKSTLQTQSWKDILLQNILAFILGISSSIVGTIIISKVKQKRALESD